MKFTKKQKDDLDEVVARIVFAMEDYILETIDWQLDDGTIGEMNQDQYLMARGYVYNKVIQQL
tara:strand:+ start:459 stop:647 length:189 start_codon:yes stop_codon:yes gene_type:complete